jgi:adenylate cyclase
MTESSTRRRLAAILAADAAGYTRLMQQDEPATVAALNQARAVFRERIAGHGGRLVDTAGDSVLAVFDSALAACACALEVQTLLGEHARDVPESRRMRFRIGLNLGDVIEQADGTVYGDGVNIAARLQALAEPGGLCISGGVHDMVEGKLDAAFEDIGAQQVKNVARPVRAFRSAAKAAACAPAPVTDRPSIVVLPFANMSADPEQEYFSDGISEDIITELSKVSGLFVIARNSSFVYKGRAVNVPEVARELGVRHVLEGSVRKAGNRVRVTAQLIDGKSGGHVWAERYDRELSDIFAVQDEVTGAIVKALSVKLTAAERRRAARRGSDSMEAYDLFLRGREQIWSHTETANIAGKAHLERALALDPHFAAAHAMFGFARIIDHVNEWGPEPESALTDAFAHSERATELDDHEALGHFVLALALMWDRRLDEAEARIQRALALEPSFMHSHAALGSILMYAGEAERALDSFETAMRLDPHYPDMILHLLGQCHYAIGNYQAAKEALEERIRRSPKTDASRMLAAAACGMLGEADAAKRHWRALFRANPDYALAQRREVLPYRDPADFDRIVEGLRRAGIDPEAAGG